MDAHIHLPFTVVVRPACVCQPQQDMEVVLAGDEVASHTSATVLAKDMLNAEILRLSLRLQEKLDFRAGQFAHLLRGDGLSRSFSLATAPTADGVVDFHIRRLPGGAMSGWIHNTLGVGETIDVAGPYGSCFYTPGMADQGLLRIGTGSGLAPLHRIALDALRQGHSGPIRLYHGSWRPEGLYLVNELRQCSADHGNFQYHPCADDKGGQHCRQGRQCSH